MGKCEHVYSLHGLLTGTVIQMGHSLAVEDTQNTQSMDRLQVEAV